MALSCAWEMNFHSESFLGDRKWPQGDVPQSEREKERERENWSAVTDKFFKKLI